MNLFKNIDWKFIWDLLKELILPHTATLIWNVSLFLFFGFLISIIYIIILYRKGVFKRQPKYYNWIVKLYIPILIGVSLYMFGQIGLVRGIYKSIDKEREGIVTKIYEYTVGEAFSSEESKKKFLISLQKHTEKAQEAAKTSTVFLNQYISQNNTGITVVDAGKNKLSSYLFKKYNDEICNLVLYSFLSIEIPHVKIKDHISYVEFNAMLKSLKTIEPLEIEKSIKKHLQSWTTELIYNQYKAILLSLIILFITLSIVPIAEFILYKKLIFPKYIDKETKN